MILTHYYGFDLGDAESAVAMLDGDSLTAPELLCVDGEKSFITAYASLENGELCVGEKACYTAGAIRRKLRFKSRFLTDSASAGDIRRFAAGVLDALDIGEHDDCLFYIGCPAGWNKQDRERYREIFERAGYPPVRIVSESRAAMVSACQSRHLQVGVDILSKPVLVVDVGSSTTDFAYIMGGREVEMHTAGEVSLGGGLLDENLLKYCVAASPAAEDIQKVFQASEPWKNYCEFRARRLKEQYFSDEEHWNESGCEETLLLRYDRPRRLTLRIDGAVARRLLEQPAENLDGRTFREVFTGSLLEVRESIPGSLPELLFLTGGVSRMPAIREWCREVFPESVIIAGTEPEFAVARGLAWSGRIDQRTRAFREELDAFIASDTVEEIVGANIDALYKSVVDALVDPILEEVAEPIFQRWRNGELTRLGDADAALQQDIDAWLHTERAMSLLVRPIAAWLKPVSEALEEYTIPICARRHVPYQSLSLRSGLSASEIDIRLDAKNLFAVEEITWLIDSILSILVGLLCGGGGVALISSGPAGIAAGVGASLLVLILGKEKMEEALLHANLPKPVRRLALVRSFHARMDTISREVKRNFYDRLERDDSVAITEKLTSEISGQIEQCLTKMAKVVEIPLG